jgi:type II secretory pathway component PulF
MVQTLRLTSRTIGENRIKDRVEDLLRAVEEGGSFSRNLTAGDVFPDTMVWKLQMAEEKGVIEDALRDLSNEFEAEVEEQTTLITKVLSPMLLLGMGLIVFLLFLAAFVPITQIYAKAGAG